MSASERSAAWRSTETESELSDDELEAVVGGLTRAFVVAPSTIDNAAQQPYTVTPRLLPITDSDVAA